MEKESEIEKDEKDVVLVEKTPEIPIPPIHETVTPDYIANFQPPYIRYYDTRYFTQFSTDELNLDVCVRIHSNKICVLFISPKHSIYQRNQKLNKVNFQISRKVNRANNKTSGKGKKGAQFLNPNSILCYLESDTGDKYPFYSGMSGKLLEVNSELIDNPNLAIEDNCSDGFIAVILCDLKKFDECKKNLKPSSEYF